MRSSTALRLAILAVVFLFATSCSQIAPHGYTSTLNKTFSHSPQKSLVLVIAESHIKERARWFGKESERWMTTLSIVRDEQPYSDPPQTGENPEVLIFAAPCKASLIRTSWTSASSIEVQAPKM